MERFVYISTENGRTRRVIVEENQVVEVAYEEENKQQAVGSIYIGRVENIVKGMEAAFVSIGHEKNAFLPLADVPQAFGKDKAHPQQVPFSKGEEIVVQITKEPIGDKGARLTMNPSYPGTFAVLLPYCLDYGISRQIAEKEERDRLLDIAQEASVSAGKGVILRTAAQGASAEEIHAEVVSLCSSWENMMEKASMRKAPALLCGGGSLEESAERDLHASILYEPLPQTLEEKLKKSLRRKVWLDSGAYLIFDYCEAMTVVDVNSGKYTGKKDLQDTVQRLNCEAAKEIARQIRLRDIGGIIVIDFVDMGSEEAQAMVLQAFTEALQHDRAKKHIYGFSAAGLLEITRRSVHQPLHHAQIENERN